MEDISHVTLHLTNKCNLMCRHCWLEACSEKIGDVIERKRLESIITDIKALGITSVKLTGGEPFLYPEIRELVAFIGNREMRIVIETNGTLLDSETIWLLKEYKCYIAVSLDGYTEEFHDWFRQKKGAFKKTLKSIEQLIENGVDMQVIWSVCRENASDIEGMLELCHKKGIKTIKINPVNLAGRAKTSGDISILCAEERIHLHEQVRSLRVKYPDIYIAYPIPPAFMPISEYAEYASECDLCSRCTILCNGDVGLCGADENSTILHFGNIYESSVREIFNSFHRKELCTDVLSHIGGICANCIHMCHCRGYCRANALYVSNDISAPYFLCQEMYEIGKFPLSRMRRGQEADHERNCVQ